MRSTYRLTLFTLVAALAAPLTAHAQVKVFEVGSDGALQARPTSDSPEAAKESTKLFRVRDDGGSQVQFTSDAPLETINGVSSTARGWVKVDPNDLASTKAQIMVPVASLRTGVDLKDEHLRSDTWLDANRYPFAKFVVTGVTGAKTLEPNKPTDVTVVGKFSIHGVTHPVSANATVRWVPYSKKLEGTPGVDGDVLIIHATFAMKLEDYKVSVPYIVRLKVSNDIKVTANIRGIDHPDKGAQTAQN